MSLIDDRPGLVLQTVVAGTMCIERFDKPMHLILHDGFEIDGKIHMEIEGNTPTTMAKSIGIGVTAFAGEFERLAPDVVVIIGDRYEALSAAIAASYMNLTILHIQGGEVSGSIDESARHAITKLAQYHFPSTDRSWQYLIKMGEHSDTILGTGCPGSDLAAEVKKIDQHSNSMPASLQDFFSREDFLLAIYHPRRPCMVKKTWTWWRCSMHWQVSA